MTSSITKRIAALATAALLATSLSACGGQSEAPANGEKTKSLSEVKDKKEEKTEDKKEEKTEDKKEKESAELHPMLKVMVDAVNSFDVKDLPNGDMFESVRGVGEAPGTLIYEFKLKADKPSQEIVDAMDKSADSMLGPTAKDIKKQMASAGISDPKVVWRYLDANDAVIWERAF